MGLPLPTPGQEPGPNYATDQNNAFTAVDQHNHSPGQGVQIGVNGININGDLTFNSLYNATAVRSIRFQPQSAVLSGTLDKGCLYIEGTGSDLYYNNGSGSSIQITSGSSLAGAAGTISGLPSGTASASYGGSTFVFQSATNTSAVIDAGAYIFRKNASGSPGLTVQPPTGSWTSQTLTLPLTPGAKSIMTLDTSGNMHADLVTDGTTITSVSSGTLSVIPGGITGITGSQIASGTITGSNIASGTITGSNIASRTITAGNLTSGTLSTSNFGDSNYNYASWSTQGIGGVATITLASINAVANRPVFLWINQLSNTTLNAGGTASVSVEFQMSVAGGGYTTIFSFTADFSTNPSVGVAGNGMIYFPLNSTPSITVRLQSTSSSGSGNNITSGSFYLTQP
jgi:hypothetical protein